MAWTGSATSTLVADNIVRVTGLSLAGAASGTIGLSTKTVAADVSLPAGFAPRKNGSVNLADSISVSYVPVTSVATLVPVMVVKTGTLSTDFVITFTNTTAATASAELDIYIRFHS